ncbi:MAG TPA: hypothetical protein VLO09_08145, partial [Ornithinimicrobium sp.]|nr:hypothetical protein [Ornithinimicrobium sp.]
MTWETRLLELYDDLEQQAEGLALRARDTDVADLGRAEYAQVDLASRLHASLGCAIGLSAAGGQVRGRLVRVGNGWCLLGAGVEETVVALPAVQSITGLGPRSDPEQVRPVVARLGLGSVLRALAEEGATVTVRDMAGAVRRGALAR